MERLTVVALLGGIAIASTIYAMAESSGDQAKRAKCEFAEVNPVTGFVGCIEPIGAPVAPPPAEASALQFQSGAAADLGARTATS
jgi:hypothetical protein